MNTSLAETIDNYVCQLFHGNIIIDQEIPVARNLTTPPKETQSNNHSDNYVDNYIASLKNQIGSLKS